VALSADAMPERIRAALSAGFDDYWTKPIQFDAFLGHLDGMISAHQAGRALR
jgi:CheY-like chemotaxis protein